MTPSPEYYHLSYYYLICDWGELNYDAIGSCDDKEVLNCFSYWEHQPKVIIWCNLKWPVFKVEAVSTAEPKAEFPSEWVGSGEKIREKLGICDVKCVMADRKHALTDTLDAAKQLTERLLISRIQYDQLIDFNGSTKFIEIPKSKYTPSEYIFSASAFCVDNELGQKNYGNIQLNDYANNSEDRRNNIGEINSLTVPDKLKSEAKEKPSTAPSFLEDVNFDLEFSKLNLNDHQAEAPIKQPENLISFDDANTHGSGHNTDPSVNGDGAYKMNRNWRIDMPTTESNTTVTVKENYVVKPNASKERVFTLGVPKDWKVSELLGAAVLLHSLPSRRLRILSSSSEKCDIRLGPTPFDYEDRLRKLTNVHVVTPFAMDLVRADEDCRLTSAGICWSFHGKSAVKNIYEDIVVDDGDMERHLSPIYYCTYYRLIRPIDEAISTDSHHPTTRESQSFYQIFSTALPEETDSEEDSLAKFLLTLHVAQSLLRKFIEAQVY